MDRDIKAKAERLMRWHRQNAFDDNDAKADRHARAIQRIVKTITWRTIVVDRIAHSAIIEGDRLTRMGY